jgi:hypothetical protein
MSKKVQGLLVAFGLVLFASNAHALLPISECVDNLNDTQTCDLWASNAAGKSAKISSPATSAFAPIFGADWAPRWVLVYGLTSTGLPTLKPSHVVVVTKFDPSITGLFADSAILYTRSLSLKFKSILKKALAALPCNADNTDTSACQLKIVRDLNGVATFQQPFVFESWEPDSTVEGFDTIDVH